VFALKENTLRNEVLPKIRTGTKGGFSLPYEADMGKHRKFSAELKAKIAVEALKGQRTVQEIASSYSVHPNQVTNWRKQLVDFSAEAFSTGRLRSDQLDEQLKTDLYAEIGRLKVELDWLQKKSGLSR